MNLELAGYQDSGRRRFLFRSLGLIGAGLCTACGVSPPARSLGETPATGATTVPPSSSSPSPSTSPSPAARPSPSASPALSSSPSTISAQLPTARPTYTRDNPPPVTTAVTRQYAGPRLTLYGDSVGVGSELDRILAARFSRDTGIPVNVVPKPQSAAENYAAYQRVFEARSPELDVLMLDVIWLGAFAPHLADLGQRLGVEAAEHYQALVENNTVAGKLVGMPWFGDFGMLYCRADLLDKYGFGRPPATWDQLEEQARRIAEGERGRNPGFAGFVFQGAAYEGLTCNALEWLASSGAGRIVENGQVTMDNARALGMFTRTQAWVGTVAPRGVTSFREEDSRLAFQQGKAAFMRQWGYAYSSMAESAISGRYIAAPLPAALGHKSVGTIGGWQLAVSQYSRNQDAAMELVRYLTGPRVQAWRAVLGGFVPTISTVAESPEVLNAQPFLDDLADVVRVARPARSAGARYNELSAEVFQSANQILNGANPAAVVPTTAERIQRIIR